MSNRLDQEREATLSPIRMEKAMKAIEEKGYTPIQVSDTQINFIHYMNHKICYFPYSGWASGSTIKDGRGLRKLLRQI